LHDFDDSSVKRQVIGLATEVHRPLGLSLSKSVCKEYLCFELGRAGVSYVRQQKRPLQYREIELDCRYQMDIVVENSVIIEIKAVDQISPIHEARLLTYLRFSDLRPGPLLNFNCGMLKDGIRRRRL
jgi:GxxExxY protein